MGLGGIKTAPQAALVGKGRKDPVASNAMPVEPDTSRPVRVFRCLDDGRPVLFCQSQMRKHVGHRMKEAYPVWWERLLLHLGWRP